MDELLILKNNINKAVEEIKSIKDKYTTPEGMQSGLIRALSILEKYNIIDKSES